MDGGELKQDDSKGEGKGASEEQHQQWGAKNPTNSSGSNKQEAGNTSRHTPTGNSGASGVQKGPCERCGLANHATKDCRRLFCEICGMNHTTFDCKRYIPWNVGPELCTAQVEDQSFFFIDECIDTSVAKEKASTAVISITRGSVNAKQIEQEFMNLIGAEGWKWYARQVADDKFLMRFPTAKMASQWSNLKNLTMRNEAQIKIEAWAPSVGSKGRLQTAWFRVSNIPADQHSIKTLSKVGALVGKVIEIDEGSRYRYDYVRLKIACREVARVPRTAEGTLGLEIIDFGFERELPDDAGPKVLKSGIVGISNHLQKIKS